MVKTYKDFKKLVIGCGEKRVPDAWNIDMIKDSAADAIIDIRHGLPFKDNSFEEIIADYVFCQIADRDDFMFILNETWRVLNGVLKLKVPNAEFPVAFKDPMDCRYFTPETFDYFNYEHYRYKVFHYGFKPWKVLIVESISGGVSSTKDRLYIEMIPIK